VRRFCLTLATLAVLAVASTGCASPPASVVAARHPAALPTSATAPTPAPRPTATAISPAVPRSPTPSRKPTATPSRKPTPKPTRTSPSSPPTPVNPWTLAGGGTGVVGPGTKGLIRYRVEIERTTGLNAASVAATVDATLANARGWTNEGWAFQRVSSLTRTQVNMIVWLATPATTDRMCAQYGLNTGGEVSCRGGNNVVINLRRWNLGIPLYSGQLDQYRRLVLNHEIGHRLGHGHAGCPAAGAPAPVMMQQYYGIGACVLNVWPYADDGTYIG